MKNLLLVLKYEYLTCVKSKVFIIITVFLVCGAFLSSMLPGFIADMEVEEIPASEEDKTTIAIMKGSYDDEIVKSEFGTFFPDNKIELTTEDRAAVESKVNDSEYLFGVEIDSPMTFVYITRNNSMTDSNSAVIAQALKNIYTVTELAKHGMSQTETDQLMNVPITGQTFSTGTDQSKNYLPVYLLMCILFTAIVSYGQFVTQSVVSEKNTRAMELLITCAKPKELMFGKVFGAGLAGLTQLGAVFLTVTVSFTYLGSSSIPDYVKEFLNFPPETMALALMFFVLGYFMFAFLLGALASFASKSEDLNGLTTPVVFILIAIYMVLVFLSSTDMVDSTAMAVLSYIPLSAPMAMFVRATLCDISAIEIIISVALQIITIVVFGILAAAIYRMGVLMYGNPPKPAEIIKMLKAQYSQNKAGK